MKALLPGIRSFAVALCLAVLCSGCGGGGEKAAEKAPDPGADATAGTATEIQKTK